MKFMLFNFFITLNAIKKVYKMIFLVEKNAKNIN